MGINIFCFSPRVALEILIFATPLGRQCRFSELPLLYWFYNKLRFSCVSNVQKSRQYVLYQHTVDMQEVMLANRPVAIPASQCVVLMKTVCELHMKTVRERPMKTICGLRMKTCVDFQ